MNATTSSISIVRLFDAPRELVFESWLRTQSLSAWFAPNGFAVTKCDVDVRQGGRWMIEYRSEAGDVHREFGEYREIARPERLVFTLTQQDGHGNTGPQTLVTVVLTQHGTKTEMRFEQSGFTAADVRDDNAEGWGECFAKLDDVLAGTPAAEAEFRAEFDEWLRSAAAKDLGAVMTKITEDVVSYEHEAPLVYRGADAVREVCRRGFEYAAGDFRWDVPDLHVIIRDDIAVTWGLNHMTAREAGKPAFDSWSRGTRVFQKTDGSWKLLHQHVSYPYDPQTGQAIVAGLEP
jgi:uncharacterized protein YndB with AHSA1/START domain/ketosteroid isomerase-like protein